MWRPKLTPAPPLPLPVSLPPPTDHTTYKFQSHMQRVRLGYHRCCCSCCRSNKQSIIIIEFRRGLYRPAWGGGCRRGRCPRCGWAAPTNAPNENLSICTTFPTVPVEGGGFVKHTHTAHITSLAHTRGTVAHKCH